MYDNPLVFLSGIIAGFLVAKLIKFIRLWQYQKDVADTLFRCLNTENDYAKELGKDSMIEYMIEKKGLSYSIFYYGSIYKLLVGQKKKTDEVEKIENALAEFLRQALKKDIQKYQQEQSLIS